MRIRRFAAIFALVWLSHFAAAQAPPTVGLTLLASNGLVYGVDGNTLYTYAPGPVGANGTTTVLNSAANNLTLCLEEPSGALLGINSASTTALQLVSVTLAGAITPVASFPSGTFATCPVMANDGNYYGSGDPGGTYNEGYLYQLTSAGILNIFYSFANKGDGTGALTTPVQASNGDLYYTGNNALVQYSATTGLSLHPTGNFSAAPVEGEDGAFYFTSGQSIYRVQTSGASTALYTDQNGYGFLGPVYPTSNSLSAVETFFEDDAHECAAGYYSDSITSVGYSGGSVGYTGGFDYNADSLSLSLFLGGNGYFYGNDSYVTDSGSPEFGCDYTTNYSVISTSDYDDPSLSPAPIEMTLSKTHVLVGGTATLTWDVTNAFSLTGQQCYGYGGLSGKLALSGTATVKATQAGTNTTGIVCGGTETNFVQLVAGSPTITLVSYSAVIPPSGSDTLVANLGNLGTPAPTGTIGFYAGSLLLGSVNVPETGTLTASANNAPPGTYQITARYSGDANYAPVTSAAVPVTVAAKTTTTTTLTPTTQTVPAGDTVQLTATVTCNSPYECPGTVELIYQKGVVATAGLTYSGYVGTATFTVSSAGFAPGTYQLEAEFPGDAWNLASNSSPATVVLQPAATPVTLVISPNPVPAGSSFTLTATVQGNVKPTGTVIFYDGSTELASTSLNSNAVAQVTLPTGTLAAGTYSITAYYAGDANNPSATSVPVSLTLD